MIATGHTELLDPDAEPRPFADLLVKPFQRERFALALDRGRQWRRQALEEAQWHAALSVELGDRAKRIAVMLQEREAEGASALAALEALAAARIPEIAAHGERVARHAQSVARALGVDAEPGSELDAAARLHDIGKAAMPDALLSKPSALTPGEMAIMRRHVEVGADILSVSAALGRVAPIVRATHEWFGGGGYPMKLAGPAIPLASRIIAVVDAYDTVTQKPAYRLQLDSIDAIAELLRCSPAQFDPAVVDAFLTVLGQHWRSGESIVSGRFHPSEGSLP